LISRFAARVEDFYETTYTLFAPWSLIFTTALSLISWAGEVLAFYLVLIGLGYDGSWTLLLKAAFILPISTLAGAVVLIAPGGLGVAEGGITGLLQVMVEGMSKSVATLAALIIRFTTLWFGVIVGLVVLAFATRRISAASVARAAPQPVNVPLEEGDVSQ
jgi:uncharacterized protein (TIRG00374 family)